MNSSFSENLKKHIRQAYGKPHNYLSRLIIVAMWVENIFGRFINFIREAFTYMMTIFSFQVFDFKHKS